MGHRRADGPGDLRDLRAHPARPNLQQGHIVIFGNLPSHKSPAAEQAIRERGGWPLFLPPYSPDLNHIEMAFAKLKARLRAMAMRTVDELWKAIGQICDLFTPEECTNYFAALGNGFT
jgi:transposase